MSIEKYNLERIKNIRVVEGTQNSIIVKATDLREMLFQYVPECQIKISNQILYRILIDFGILVKGFRPSKTALRHTYKLSIEKINEILPGSYKSKETDGRRRGLK